MALPTNRIKKIKLPNNTEYEIIPGKLQGTNSAGTTSYQVSVPTLSSDDTIVTTKTTQTITGAKTFSDSITANGNISIRTDEETLHLTVYDGRDGGVDKYALSLEVHYDEDDNFIGTSAAAGGHFTAYGDNDHEDEYKPDDETGFGDLDTDYFNTGITLRDAGDDTAPSYKLSFPTKSGVFAVTSDIQNVEIVDLTQVNA